MNDHMSPNLEEHENGKTALLSVISHFEQVVERCFSQLNSQEIPAPDPLDQPLDLSLYREAIATLDLGEILSPKLLEAQLSFIDKAPAKMLRQRYPGGKKICINVLPFTQGDGFTAEPFIFGVSSLGLTRGPFGDDAYYFRNFPQEIQDQSTFAVPYYENPEMPSHAEREALKAAFLTAWNSTKTLLEV